MKLALAPKTLTPGRLAAVLGALATNLLASPPVAAYQLETAGFNKVRWQHNFVNFEIVTASLDPGDQTAIVGARNLWNSGAANFTITTFSGDAGYGYLNGENEIARVSNHWLVGAGGATCQYWFSPFTGHIVEADIWFDDHPNNTHTTSKTQMLAYGGSMPTLLPGIAHELGHALGLKHEADVYNIMGEDWTMLHSNGSSATPYLGADAMFGAAALYGFRNNSGRDLTAVHWKRTGASGEYSDHGRTAIYSLNGLPRPWRGPASDRRYHVQAGRPFRAQFTYENLRPSPSLADIDFYVSTNITVSPADTSLASASMLFAPMMSVTTTHTLTIPTSAGTGDRAVGPVVANAGEISTSNNATYTRVWVVPAAAGGASFCSTSSPCDWGEGDCDSDAECAGTLTCQHNVGAEYGWQSAVDVCE